MITVENWQRRLFWNKQTLDSLSSISIQSKSLSHVFGQVPSIRKTHGGGIVTRENNKLMVVYFLMRRENYNWKYPIPEN